MNNCKRILIKKKNNICSSTAIVSLFLTLSIVMTIMPRPANAASTWSSYTLTVNSKTYTVKTDTISHSTAASVYSNSCKDYAVGSGKHVCCAGYAASLYKYLWGTSFSQSATNNMLSNLTLEQRRISVENLKWFFTNAKPGSDVRFDKSTTLSRTDYGHELIFLGYNSSTELASFWEGNYDGAGGVRIWNCTFAELYKRFNDKGYIYMPYIIYPNAVKITPTALSEVPTIQNATAPESLSNGDSFDLKGTINCKYPITEIQGVIYNCTAGTKLFDVSVAPNTNSYTLGASGDAISSGLKFNDSSLYDSWCRFELKVTYDKNGETCVKRIHDRYFSVGSPSIMTLLEPGVYQFVCDDESRSAPGEGNSIVNNYSKGSIIFAVGYEYKTNVWLVLTDGSYVFSGDVDRVTWAEDDFSGTLTFLSPGVAETYPYTSGPDYQQYDAGSQVTVIAQLTNTEGEVWYKIVDGSYVYSGNVEYKNNCDHPDVEIITIKEAYLGEYGLRQKQCAVCGEIIETWAYYEAIPVLTNSNFILPSSIKYIEEEAFEGIPAAYINLKCCNVESIGKRAFANCENLLQIFIPQTVISIDEDAFGEKTDFMIFGYSGTKAESFAKEHGIQFIIMDVYGWWEPVEYFPDNETMDQVKTQYRYRDKVTAGGYTEWSEWSAWSNTQQSITADDLMQEESMLRYYWWAAQCTSCGHNNPYHGSSSKCYNCGKTLANNQGLWKTVEKYTDDYSGTQTIHGRSGGRYFDGIPYWNDSEKQVTQFRYRTRDYLIGWSDWSAWSDAIAYPSDTREVETRIMGHVQGD